MQPYYIAPEVVSGAAYTAKADVWSCGVVACILLTGIVPLDGITDEEILSNIKAGRLSFLDEVALTK